MRHSKNVSAVLENRTVDDLFAFGTSLFLLRINKSIEKIAYFYKVEKLRFQSDLSKINIDLSIKMDSALLYPSGTASKFDLMCKKYTPVTSSTGHDIYNDDSGDFEISKEYLEFMNDYNRMIHREIKNNNPEGVYSLCKWIYYCDRAFPWFEPMMKIALEFADIKTFTLVFWMFHTWYEELDNDLTEQDMINFAKGSQDEKSKLELLSFIKYVKGSSEHCTNDDDAENYDNISRKAVNKVFLAKMIHHGINLTIFLENQNAAIERVNLEYKKSQSK